MYCTSAVYFILHGLTIILLPKILRYELLMKKSFDNKLFCTESYLLLVSYFHSPYLLSFSGCHRISIPSNRL